MATLVSPDGKTEISTKHPAEIVRLKADGFTEKTAQKSDSAPAKTPK